VYGQFNESHEPPPNFTLALTAMIDPHLVTFHPFALYKTLGVRERLDADGNQHGYYFCSNCHQEYVNRLRDADNSFESWKKNGGKQNG